MRDTFLPYALPDVGEREIAAVVESLRRGWLTTGPQTAAFEEAFARASGVRYAVALNSCTAALHLALLAVGVGEGDDVVTPSLTFAAGTQCVLEVGARPVFCDVDADSFSMTPESVERVVTRRTKVIIAMPYGGRPLGIERLCAFARERGISVIEDAAHGAGMLDAGSWAGTHSAAATYSFYATKNVTTGEGGMLVTNDDAIAQRVRRLSLHGMSRDAWKRYQQRGSWRYDVLEPGYKYNMPDLAASVGLAQLDRLDEMQSRRESIARRYREAFGRIPGLHLQRAPDRADDRHAWCMFAIAIDPVAAGIDRDLLIDHLQAANIGTSVHYIPTHRFSAYRSLADGPLPVTDSLGDRILSLPLYPLMTLRDVEDVIAAVAQAIGYADEAMAI